MKIIVGLGNVGQKYDDTRHNAGFMAIDAYAHTEDFGDWVEKSKFQAYIIQQPGLFLVKPTTYMNLSGQTIAMAMAFYGVRPEDILIIHDDVDIDFGTIRIRQGGSSGGHNGIKSLPQNVQDDAWRIRIGVKNKHFDKTNTEKFVLDKFGQDELKQFDELIKSTNQVIEDFLENDIESETLTLDQD